MTDIQAGMIVRSVDDPTVPFKVLKVQDDGIWITRTDGWEASGLVDPDGFEQSQEDWDLWERTTRRVLALREIANFMEAHSEVEVDHVTAYSNPVRVDFYTSNEEELRTILKALGSVEKQKDYSGKLTLEKKTDLVRYGVTPPADTCKQVVVGKEVKMVRKVVAEAVYEEVEEEVDITEWQCPESVLGGK